MRYVVRSLGLDASVVYIWGGCSSSYECQYRWHHTPYWEWVSIRVPKSSAHEGAPVNPHFMYHAEVDVNDTNSTYYDPSYNSTGLIEPDEFAPAGYGHAVAAVRQTGSSRAPYLHQVDQGYECPHSY
jgi:hypothetical protein